SNRKGRTDKRVRGFVARTPWHESIIGSRFHLYPAHHIAACRGVPLCPLSRGSNVLKAAQRKEDHMTGVEAVAKHIASNGGRVPTAVVDSVDDTAVNHYINGIASETGKVDILIDLAGPLAKEYGNGQFAVDLPVEAFMVPLDTMVRSRFITA